MQKHRRRALGTALLAVALAALGLAGTAQAKLTGEYTRFANCPYTNLEVKKCLLSTTTSGEVVLGKKVVPITKSVVLQGGAGKQVEGIAPFFAASNGITLSKAPQNVPGGLLGIVPDASSPFLVKALIKFFLENSLTGVNSTLELAKPATEIRVSENNLAAEEGVALKMPVMVHLENPFLGKSCYVGSRRVADHLEPDHRHDRTAGPEHQNLRQSRASSNSSKKARSPSSKKPNWSTTPGLRPKRPVVEGFSPSSSPRSSTRSSAPPRRATTRRSSTTRSTSPPPLPCASTTKNTHKGDLRKEMIEMRRRKTAIGAAFAALAVLCAMFATTASAAPAWKFESKSLEGTEVVLGGAIESSMTVPGLTTKCENFLYKLTVENASGTGKGSLTEMPLYNCTTNSKFCTVDNNRRGKTAVGIETDHRRRHPLHHHRRGQSRHPLWR